METRIRRQAGAQASPERPRPWPEPPPSRKLQSHHHHPQQQPVRRIPVVYYLSKNHHLEHPHFIEVPVSSPDGLYLRDVINRLVVLRGRRMPGMYSWSCKRGYKNGFVWHDLSEDDLILPVHGNEYVLKGSELLDRTPSDRGRDTGNNLKVENSKQCQHDVHGFRRTRERHSSSSPPPTSIKDARSPSRQASIPCLVGSSGNASPKQWGSPHPSWEAGSPSLVDYRVVKPSGAIDASTQTDDNGGTKPRERGHRRTRANDEILELELEERHLEENQRSKELSGAAKNGLSPPPLSASPLSSYGKIDTLESLIREDARKMNTFRILEEEEVFVPTRVKMTATNLLMQLITCGAISVKDHRSLGLIPTYKPSYSHMNVSPPMFTNSVLLGERDSPLEASSFVGSRMDEKECFSGTLLETMNYKEGVRKGAPNLQRSSYEENRNCESPNLEDEDKEVGSHRSKCLPRPFRVTAVKPSSRNEALLSPASDVPKNTFAASICNQSRYLGSSHGGSNRISDSSSARGSSIRLESLREEKSLQGEKGKVIKIEERLTSGARVIIQSRAPLSDSDDSAGSC